MKSINTVNKYKEIKSSELEKITGGNIFSQARDAVWGFLDGLQGRTTSSKSRHHG